MKYVVILGDGMADEPIDALGGKTPLEYAGTPNLDGLSPHSKVGMVRTIPEGMKPGSDTANLSVMGYDPRKYYSGRSPLEALSIGVAMKDTDIALRCNVLTLSEEEERFEDKRILDHSASEIPTGECRILLEAVAKELGDEVYSFYVGTSYRHCLIWREGRVVELTPPHDVLGQRIAPYIPEDARLAYMMRRSYDILVNHPINIERKKRGLNPANCCWFWGAGTKPALTSFKEKTGKRGMMISAVDLLKGIAAGAGMDAAGVEGANGGLHTNYEGKVDAALKALLEDGYDFAYIHIEAPDEMGHQGSAERKIEAIEYLDKRVIGPVVDGLRKAGEDFRLLVMPDHPTPIRLRTHTANPVPFLLYDSRMGGDGPDCYTEGSASRTGIHILEGYTLIDELLEL